MKEKKEKKRRLTTCFSFSLFLFSFFLVLFPFAMCSNEMHWNQLNFFALCWLFRFLWDSKRIGSREFEEIIGKNYRKIEGRDEVKNLQEKKETTRGNIQKILIWWGKRTKTLIRKNDRGKWWKMKGKCPNDGITQILVFFWKKKYSHEDWRKSEGKRKDIEICTEMLKREK